MEFFVNVFNTILYQPLLKVLLFLANSLPNRDIGIAIIVLTVIIKLILFPFSLKAIKAQIVVQKLQPRIKEIQQKYKEDRLKQSEALLELYRKEKLNPFAFFFPLLLQLPILIALYLVFLKGLKDYPNLLFLGYIDLSQSNLIIALLAGISQFFYSKISFSSRSGSRKERKTQEKIKDLSYMIQTQMIYFFPFLTIIIVWQLGAAIGLYWTTSNFFSFIEHWLIMKLDIKKGVNSELKK